MDSAGFDRLAKLVSAASVSRREAFRRLVGAAGAGLAATRWRPTRAQEATPAAAAGSNVDAQAQLDALDADTRDSLARALWLPELRADALSPQLLASILAPKNSNEAFGLRMGARLLALISTPVSFVPGDTEERLAALLPYCDSLSPHQAYIMTNLIGNDAAEGYRPVPEKADIQFPQANAMVLGSQVGWYFFVGSCTGSDGTEYGVELMFFRFALLPTGASGSVRAQRDRKPGHGDASRREQSGRASLPGQAYSRCKALVDCSPFRLTAWARRSARTPSEPCIPTTSFLYASWPKGKMTERRRPFILRST